MLLPAKSANVIHALWKVFGKVLPSSECILQQKKRNNHGKCVTNRGTINVDISTIHQLLLRYAAFITVQKNWEYNGMAIYNFHKSVMRGMQQA
jgi:hypothetical protein